MAGPANLHQIRFLVSGLLGEAEERIVGRVNEVADEVAMQELFSGFEHLAQSINQIRFYYQPTTTARLRGGGGTGAQNIRVEYVLRCCLLMKASQLTRSQFPKSTYVTLQC